MLALSYWRKLIGRRDFGSVGRGGIGGASGGASGVGVRGLGSGSPGGGDFCTTLGGSFAMTRFIVRFANRRRVGRDQRAFRACALVAASASRDLADVRLTAQGAVFGQIVWILLGYP